MDDNTTLVIAKWNDDGAWFEHSIQPAVIGDVQADLL